MKCPQCQERMQGAASLTPNSSWCGKALVRTTHYLCDSCDAEYVRLGRGELQKIDGGMVALDANEVEIFMEAGQNV